jgi:hypothetical protein
MSHAVVRSLRLGASRGFRGHSKISESKQFLLGLVFGNSAFFMRVSLVVLCCWFVHTRDKSVIIMRGSNCFLMHFVWQLSLHATAACASVITKPNAHEVAWRWAEPRLYPGLTVSQQFLRYGMPTSAGFCVRVTYYISPSTKYLVDWSKVGTCSSTVNYWNTASVHSCELRAIYNFLHHNLVLANSSVSIRVLYCIASQSDWQDYESYFLNNFVLVSYCVWTFQRVHVVYVTSEVIACTHAADAVLTNAVIFQ